MIPSRLFSARLRVLEGMGRWTPSTQAVLGPGWLLPQHASPRLLSVSCADGAKHQEPRRKKLLSEKQLVRPVNRRNCLQCPLTRQRALFEFLSLSLFILMVSLEGRSEHPESEEVR